MRAACGWKNGPARSDRPTNQPGFTSAAEAGQGGTDAKAAEEEEPNDGEVEGSLDPDMALIASLAEAAGEAPADEDEHPQEELQIVRAEPLPVP